MIKLKSAYDKDYAVKLISDQDISLAGSGAYLYIEVEHNRTEHTYYFQSLNDVSITGGVPTEIKINTWKNADGTDKPNEKFTGNEDVNVYIIRQTGSSEPNLQQVIGGQNVFKKVAEGERVGSFILKNTEKWLTLILQI